METKQMSLCEEVGDDLARILDGSAPEELYDHIATCDACRDLRHDAAKALDVVKHAGGDFRPQEDLDVRVLALLDARAEKAPSTERMTAPEAKKEEPKAEAKAEPEKKTETVEAAPLGVEAKAEKTDEAKPAKETEKAPVPVANERAVVRVLRDPRGRLGLAGFALVATAAAAFVFGRPHHHDTTTSTAESAPWKGEIAGVARVASGRGGVQRCDSSGNACADVGMGTAFDAGSILRTDGKTRAELHLADGTSLVLDRDTEIALRKDRDRSARLVRGAIVADVSHLEDGAHAKIAVPAGEIEVLGTKFVVTSEPDRTRVDVSRGTVRLHDEKGGAEDVHAGEEGRVARGQSVVVAPSTRIADEIAWSERSFQEKTPKTDKTPREEEPLRGLGELRARKPGQTDEKDQAVRLAKHDVKVRIVDNFARTEIDETFQNDSSEELEGIYRFPLPPDAQIERLALEVNGKLEEGAFVDKDRAAAIWRGVIHNAAPKAPKPQEEIVWVPGPWRDPALLEWKRGGRFELRIFPIPAKGSRRVVLSYTQTVPPVGGVRRYTYPLPYDPKGSTTVDSFHLDAQVIGHDKGYGVRPRGYALTSAQATDTNADRLEMSESKFVPAGDLTIEYALPSPNAEVSAWAYQPANEDAGYAVLALRPKLPKPKNAGGRDEVLVVDASRSMVGERFAKARALVTAMIAEMDASDRVLVLACDTSCRAWDGGLVDGGATASNAADKFLGSVTPDGAADLTAMVRSARDAAKNAGRDSSHALHVVYVGDGGASAGPVKPDHLTAAIKKDLGSDEIAVDAVAIGSDADTTLLAALARSGGGVVVPFVPGQRTDVAAVAALAATYGTSLQSPEVTLPAGFTALAPTTLDTMRAGGETLVLARMTAKDVEGDVVLRGKVNGEPFESKVPVHVVATSDAGNAFVPRLYAAARIADLEQSGGEQAKTAIVDLSKRFSVASRYTSLLVLESEAMLHAFGIQRASGTPSWTGESSASGTTAGDATPDDVSSLKNEAEEQSGADFAPGKGGGGLGSIGGGTLGHASGAGMGAARSAAGPMPKAATKEDADFPSPAVAAPPPPPAPTATSTPLAEKKKAAVAREPMNPFADDRLDRDRAARRPPFGRMIPMKKVWDRKGTIVADNGSFQEKNAAKIVGAEGALAAKPDARQATKDLFAAYALAGRVEKAGEVADRWATRDALDPEALVARADVAARMGDRDAAIRILGGTVDVRPDDAVAQTRLATLREIQGDVRAACAHRITNAELHPTDVAAQALAIRCARAQGTTELADRLLADVASDKRAALDRELDKAPATSDALRGDVRIEATWDDGADLDVALVDKTGKRLSWLGGATKAPVTAKDATSTRDESVAFLGLGAGPYVIEVDRAKASTGEAPIHGTLTIHAVGETRQIPFTLVGARVEVGRIEISYTSRLVPLDRPW